MKRRTTKHAPVVSKSAPKITSKPTATADREKVENKEAHTIAIGKENPPGESKSGRSTPQQGPTSSLKRSDSKTKAKKDTSAGDLFKSFAKAKPKVKDVEKPEDNGMFGASRRVIATKFLPEAMQGMSEDEGDADDEPVVKFDEEKAAAARKAREEREQKLREMMEADGINARRKDGDTHINSFQLICSMHRQRSRRILKMLH